MILTEREMQHLNKYFKTYNRYWYNTNFKYMCAVDAWYGKIIFVINLKNY